MTEVPEGYEELYRTLMLALDQAATGKGAERHADGQPWEAQPISRITALVGVGFPLGQALKKVDEAARMIQAGDHPRRPIAELLGAIVYLAKAVEHLKWIGR